MKKLGIIGAMEMEVALLKEEMQKTVGCVVTERAGMSFCEGELRGQRAVVVRSGVGKVNAAVCTQILADVFGVDAILNTGVAGSLQAEIDIGDFVLSTDVMHHDVDATVFGYQPGEVPQLGTVTFPADEALIRLCTETFDRLALPEKLFCGRIVSGDQFIVADERKEQIRQTCGGMCTEMEGAAIAQTAWLNHIPFIVLRAVSDKADKSSFVAYPVFEEKAARACARLTLALCERAA